MSDNRLFIRTPIGNVQAYAAEAGDTCVAMSWTSHVQNHPSKVAWSTHGLYLSTSDARAIAAALIEAADHADAVQIKPEEEAA